MIPGRVLSSHIFSIEYDAVAKKMRITFNSGKRYEYKNVPLYIYTGLIGEKSIGQAFNAVKDLFDFEQINSIKIY